MKEARTTIKEAKESDAEKKKKKSVESSIFSTILADIEDNPTILQNQKKFSDQVSIFSTIRSDIDELSPTILHKTKKKNKKLKKAPIDFTCTVPQTLTRSDLVDILNQELKILKSEIEINGQTSDRFVSRRECDCVEAKFLGGEVLEWIYRDDLKSEISTDAKDFDEMLSTMLGDEVDDDDEHVNNAEEGCGEIDEFVEEILEKVEKDGSYLERIKEDYVFGWLLENLLRDRLREKAEKEENEISSWITNGEPEAETGVAEEEETDIKKTKKKKSPVKVKMDRTEQESSVSTKRDCSEFRRRLYLIEKLRERDENQRKRRVKAVRFGVEFSILVAECMFLIPNEVLASEIEDYWMCLKRFGVCRDDKGTSVIIGKLEEVFEMVMRKKENKEHHNVNLPESIFRFEGYIRHCADAIQVLGKIVWALRRNQSERLNLSDLDSLFEDCQKVLMKIELKLAEMKQRVYRSVSADYESFSKSERFDILLRSKLMKRVNADNRFGRSVVGSCLVEIWKSLFQAEALHEQRKEA